MLNLLILVTSVLSPSLAVENLVFKPSLSVDLKDVCRNKTIIRDPNDCAKFWMCHHGKEEQFQCPQGLLFDIKYNVCNYANLVDCDATTTITPTSTTSAISSTTSKVHPNSCPKMFSIDYLGVIFQFLANIECSILKGNRLK